MHRRFGAQENDDDTPGLSGMRLQGIGGADNDVLMPPLPGSMLGTSGMHEQHINAVLQNMMRSSMGGMTGGDDQHGDMSAHIREMMAAYAEQSGDNSAGIAGMGRRQDRYDEDGVRMPDPVQRQRLVPMGRSYSAGEDEEDRFALGRAEDPSVEWMFPPPRHLSSQATLEKVLFVEILSCFGVLLRQCGNDFNTPSNDFFTGINTTTGESTGPAGRQVAASEHPVARAVCLAPAEQRHLGARDDRVHPAHHLPLLAAGAHQQGRCGIYAPAPPN